MSAARPLCLVLSLDHYKALTGKTTAEEVEFFKLFSQLQLEPLPGDDGAYAIRYCGSNDEIHKALRQAAVKQQRLLPASRKRPRLEDPEERKSDEKGVSGTIVCPPTQTVNGPSPSPMDMAVVPYVPNHSAPSRRVGACGSSVHRPPHPRIPSEVLTSIVTADRRLDEVYQVHRYWFGFLLSKGFSKEFLYNKLYPCKTDSTYKGCVTQGCTRQHGIEVMLFVTSAAVIKWGFHKHRSVRRPMKDPADFGDPTYTNVCISWALRNLLGTASYGSCQEGPPQHATKPQHIAEACRYPFEAQIYHSFWMLEEWCLRVYVRVPLHKRDQRIQQSMSALGYDNSVFGATSTASLQKAFINAQSQIRSAAPLNTVSFASGGFGTAANTTPLAANRLTTDKAPPTEPRDSRQTHPWWVDVAPRKQQAQPRRSIDERMTEGRLIDYRPSSSSSVNSKTGTQLPRAEVIEACRQRSNTSRSDNGVKQSARPDEEFEEGELPQDDVDGNNVASQTDRMIEDVARTIKQEHTASSPTRMVSIPDPGWRGGRYDY